MVKLAPSYFQKIKVYSYKCYLKWKFKVMGERLILLVTVMVRAQLFKTNYVIS